MTIESDVRTHLAAHFPSELVNDIIENYLHIKERFYTRKYRDSAFYGGRFAEGMLRILQYITQGSYTPLGSSLPNFHNTIISYSNLPRSSYHDSIRIYIPKALDVLYDIRNNRNIGHSGGDINENYSDANLSVTISSWVLVELIRLYYVGDIDHAQDLVNKLIRIHIPLVQDFNGYLRILRPELPIRDKIMALSFYRLSDGITHQEFNNFLSFNHTPSSIGRSLSRLVELALLHKVEQSDKYYITDAGIAWVEENISFEIR